MKISHKIFWRSRDILIVRVWMDGLIGLSTKYYPLPWIPLSRCCGKMYECPGPGLPGHAGAVRGVRSAVSTGDTRGDKTGCSLQFLANPRHEVIRRSGWWWREGASCVLTSWGLLGKISSILWRCWLVLTMRVMISEMWCNKNQMLCSHNLKLTLISLYNTGVTDLTATHCPDKACLETFRT